MELKELLRLIKEFVDVCVVGIMKNDAGTAMRLQLSMWLVGAFVEKATQISFQRIPQKYTSLDVRCLQIALSLIAVGGGRTREVDAVPLHVLTMCRSPHFGATLLVHTKLHGRIGELKVVPSAKQTRSPVLSVSNQCLEPPRPLVSDS